MTQYIMLLVSDVSSAKIKMMLSAKINDIKNKRTMMVLYRSPEYQAVQVNNEDKYQIDH